MEQKRRYKEPQDTLWGKFLSGFMAVVFAMSTLTLIPIASAINGVSEEQVLEQQQKADETSGKQNAVEPAADEQKLEPVELLSIASVEDEDDADDAAPADVTLKVKAENATVTYNGNDVATELVVPADKDVKFTVKAADGFTLGAAAVKLADAKGETTLTPNAGEYTVAADRVADGATVVVTAEAVAGSANTDAAEPSTPAPSTEQAGNLEQAKETITTIIDSLFGGTSTLTISGENTVAVNDTIELTSDKGSYNHSWSSSNRDVATVKVTSDGKTATVTGVTAGTVTITHKYKNRRLDQEYSETFTVTVTGTWVYVYTKVNGDTTGLVTNKDGWYTLGKVWVDSLPAATGNDSTDSANASLQMEETVIQAVNSDSFTRYSENQGISIENVNFNRQGTYGIYGLHNANGASDIDGGVSGNTWHLDGIVDVAYLGSVVYRCCDEQGNLLEDVDIPTETYSVGKEVNKSKTDAPGITGYTCTAVATSTSEHPDPTTGRENVSFSVEHTTHYVTYIYKKNTYSVTYTDGVDDEVVFEDQNFSVAHGDATPTVDAPTRTGYVFAGWDPEVAQTVNGDATYTATWKEDRNNNGVDDATEYRTVTYKDGADGAVFADNAITEVNGVKLLDGDATPTVDAPTRTGYVFAGWDPEVAQTVNGDATYTATWALDVIGTDPTDPGNNVPDGIADKYQLVVTFGAINGTIDGATRYVLNKYDAAGNLAEDGVAVLTAAQIPGVTADDGYGNGTWNDEPLANMELTENANFIIAFTALPAAAPDATPAAAAPLAPVAAAAPAAAVAAAATILDDGVPLATIDDDENALAAFEEVHCWTHWLMIFGALVTIVYGLAVLYRRRHGIRDMDDFEGDIMGGRKYDAATEKNPAAGNAFQVM